MKRQFTKLFGVIATFCIALTMIIGVCGISVAAAEGESTLSLSLIGDSTIYLQKGTEYKELGATAYDTVEGDLTESITINNGVQKDTVGTYTVSYSVSNGSSETASASRTVIVFDCINQEDQYLWRYSNYSSSYNTYKKIISTSDGGYLLAGDIYNGSYSRPFLQKYNSDMVFQWSSDQYYEYYYSYQYLYDAVELVDGNYLVLSHSNHNNRYIATVRDKTSGTSVFSTGLEHVPYKKIQKISDCQYALFAAGYSDFLLLTYNPDTQAFSTTSIKTSFAIQNAIVSDGCLYSLQNSGDMYKMNLETGKVSSFNSGLSLTTCVEETYGEYVFFCNGQTIYKMDGNFDIVKSFSYGTSNIQQIYVNDTNVIAKYGQSIIFLNSDLEYVGETKTQDTFYAYDLYLDEDANVYYCGQYYDSYYYCGAVKISDITLFASISELHSTLNQEIVFDNGVGIVDAWGNSLGTYTCDSTQVDNTKVGNYKAYYTFTAIDDEGIKTYYVGRDIIVEPITTFEDGAVYSGSKVVDVEGGSVTINGTPCSYGDVYNIPGKSQMVITGENGYTKTINFEIELVVDGVENGIAYYTPVIPVISGGSITLDGEAFESETPITTKGHHTLIITGANGFNETINFTIEPTIIGVADGKTYTETLYPNINAETMTLNGEVYNNEPIENCGNYTLTITGTNGYTKTITFVIDTVISNLVNGETYEEEVTPTFTKGTATLNGEPYESGTTIYTPGLNTLIITGEDGYSVTYQFTINLGVENVSQGETYIGEVTPIISGGIITLNDQPYVSGTTIDVPGYYTITVLGADGYRNDIHFVVKPYEINVVNGETYNHSVIPVVSNGSLTLNDAPYTSGTVINTSGEYTLVIIGENGYYESIAFTLITGANVEDGAHYNDSVTLKFVGTATLNGVDVLPDTIIEKVGNYQLVLVDGENTFTYNFVIEPDYSIFNGRITSCVIGFANCTVTLNGEAVTNAIELTEVGNYSLVVEGENGYTKTINFAICAETNVANGGQYASGLVVNANGGSIELNGAEFTDGTILTEVGTYILKISGENGHEENIIFNIVPEVSDINNATVYYGSVTPSIIGGILTLNGEEYTTGTAITEEGVYQLVISGVGGYTQTINFVVLSEEFEIKENGIYMQSMSITHNVCGMEINGAAYSAGTAINTVGKNTLTFIYNGERTDVTFYIFPLISGVENGAVYEGSATPVVEWNNLLLDGNPYVSGTPITDVGHHTLTVGNLNGYNYEITFTVKEVWENIEAGGRYEYSVAPKTDNGTLYLDGVAFSNGSTIYTVGHHTIRLVGANGYESEITFTVTETINNLENGKEYTGIVNPVVSNSAVVLYLDGNYYSNGYIYDVGYHTLRVEGTNGYVSEYHFTILPSVSGAQPNTEYTPGGTRVSCSYATIKLNGEIWSSGSYVYNVGYYTVEIIGTNGYVYTYEFTVIPSISGAQDGGEYSSSTYVSCNYATLKLNGNDYSSGSNIYDIGYHEIEIIGVGGYTKTICFTRTPDTSITDGEEVDYSKSVSVSGHSRFTNTVVKLDGEILTSSKTIYTIGYHTLTIEGVNDYYVEKHFTVKANWSGTTNGTSYNSTSGTYLVLRSSGSSSSVLSEEYYEKILLDGQVYTNNTNCYTVGNHKFEIYGANGYVETIEFVINPVTNNLFDTSSVNIKNDTSYPFSLSDGIYTSTNKGHSSSATFKITAVTDIEFTLSYFVSSEANYDKLKVVKNGTEIINVSGSPGWADRVITMKAGEILTISYSKDGSASNGADCAKFRLNMKSEGAGTKLIPEIYLDNTNMFQDENTYVLLDGQPYTLNSTIDTVGYHTLKIFGVGGYEKEYKITVIPTIADIADDATYEGSVTPNIDRCDILLDGEAYISGTPIVAVGYHTIEMFGVNGYVLSYSFTVTPSHVDDYSDEVFYNGVAVNTIENATLYLDGELYNGEKITSLGYHTIKIEGTNGYEQSFSFSIAADPIIKDVNGYKDFVDGFTSEYMVNITFPDVELFIDGVAYTSGTDYYTVGLHYLRIVGANGYEAEYTFTLTERVNGLVDGQAYSSLELNCADVDALFLNGQEVANLTAVNRVGNYTLVVSGTNGYTNEYNFTVGLDLKNVTNGGVYTSAISPIVNAENIYLNGKAFTSGTAVSIVGYYSMRIEGAGGYVHEISFTITDNLRGLNNGMSYLGNVTPVFNKATAATLDGVAFTSGTLILGSNIGIHKLKIVGVGGYSKEYVFTIAPVISGIEIGETYQGSVSPVVNGGAIKLNGKAIELTSPITTVGNNKLTIHGANGYVYEIAFTVEPVFENLQDSYSMSCKPNISGTDMTMKLNGNTYTNGTEIKTTGHNILTISGNGGYSKTYTITIVPQIEGIENGSEVFGKVQINVSPSATLSIDGASYTNNAEYKKVGNHTLTIKGLNGYEQVLTFTLKEDSSTISAEQYTGVFKLQFDKNNFTILIDGNNYSSNTNYYTIGNHELMIVGTNGYTSTYDITVIPQLNGIENNGTYNEKVTITTSNGKFNIDGVAYKTGDVYKLVGNHTLTMTGSGDYEYSIAFTVTPKVSGITEGGSYSSTASWSIPTNCTAKLDGASVNVNSSTSKIGNHTIVIEGANGYQTSISFTVTETINIVDGTKYNKAITIDIPDCSAVLNDLEISDLYELNTPGSYTLTVFGTNGYTNEYEFTVISVLSGIVDGQEYDGSVTANTSIGQWYLDDEPYVSGTLITEIGHHTLKVSGPDYEQICSFTITVDVSAYAESLKKFNYTDSDLELYIDGEKYSSGASFKQVGNHTVEYRGANGYISSADFTIEYTYNGNADYKYQDSAVIDIPNATLYVNGTQIENLTEITSIGNNIVTIKGANGYEKAVEIFIAPTLTVANGEERDEKITIKKLNATMYLDGVAISGDTVVDTHGTHTLRIEGANGYVEEISFTFNNPNNSYVIMISIVVGLVAAAFVTIIILRKKVL